MLQLPINTQIQKRFKHKSIQEKVEINIINNSKYQLFDNKRSNTCNKYSYCRTCSNNTTNKNQCKCNSCLNFKKTHHKHLNNVRKMNRLDKYNQ